MIQHIVLQEYIQDCKILLDRALLNKSIVCFGADGNGQYGSSQYPKYFKVIDIQVNVYSDEDDILFGTASIFLDGYDSKENGHVATDLNLKISLNQLLINEMITTSCWTWAELQTQGENFFTINFDVMQLLD